MDVRMPASTASQATRLLPSWTAPPRVLVVTTFENDDYVYDALRAGAPGLPAEAGTPRTEIVHADPDRSSQRVAVVPGRGPGAGSGRSPTSHAQRRRTRPRRLTEREQEVLRLMARGLSNAEIAGRADPRRRDGEDATSRNMLAKLGARDRTQAVIVAYESGFVSPH